MRCIFSCSRESLATSMSGGASMARVLAVLALYHTALAWNPSLHRLSSLGQRKNTIRWSDQPNMSDLKKQQRDLEAEERQLEIRAKIEALQRLKSQGKSYDGSASVPREGKNTKSQYASKLDSVSESILQQTMTSAESFLNPETKSKADTTTASGEEIEIASAAVLAAADEIEASMRSEAQAKARAAAASAQADLNPIMAASKAAAAAAAVAAEGSSTTPAEANKSSVTSAESLELSAPPAPENEDFAKKTSGIGGNWKPSAETTSKTHKPSTSGSWGVFERPADISAAYGGGKQIGIGGYQSSEAEQKAAIEETKAKLKAFRKAAGGGSPNKEFEYAYEIDEALSEARAAMARGYCSDAVDALTKVEPFLSYGTIKGGTCFIELGMACEAVGLQERAMKIYKKVTAQNSDEAIRRQAKQLTFGFEAMDFLYKTPDSTPLDASNFQAKSSSKPVISPRAWSGEYFDRSYSTAYVLLSDDKKKRLGLLEATLTNATEAKEILLRACALRGRNRDMAVSSVSVMAALRCLYKKGPGGGCSSSPAATSGNNDSAEGSTGGRATSSENEQSNAATLESQEAENDPLALAGRWRLCLTASESGRLTFWSDQADTVPPTFREYASPPLPSEGNSANGLQPWSAPQVTLPLPFGLRAEGSATLGGAYGGWPNADWELSLEPSTDEEVSTADTPTALSSSGSRTSNGFFVGQFELPFAPTMPPPVTVLALDGQLMVTAETKRGKGPRASRVGIPGCEVWIRDNCPVKL